MTRVVACSVGEWATGMSTVGAVMVLLLREARRMPSAGIPPALPPAAGVEAADRE